MIFIPFLTEKTSLRKEKPETFLLRAEGSENEETGIPGPSCLYLVEVLLQVLVYQWMCSYMQQPHLHGCRVTQAFCSASFLLQVLEAQYNLK